MTTQVWQRKRDVRKNRTTESHRFRGGGQLSEKIGQLKFTAYRKERELVTKRNQLNPIKNQRLGEQ
jgi:hypothetical protein